MSNKKQIVFDAERMKYANTGLYHYCKQLGLAIKNIINKNDGELVYYVRKSNLNEFGVAATYKIQKGIDKFCMPTKNVNIWHCTYQATNYYPNKKNVKVVFTIHDLNVIHEKCSPQKIKKELFKIQQKINKAAHVVAISTFTLNDVKQYLTLGNTPSSVIYNGCNFTCIENIEPPLTQITEPFIFTIGTINAKKNFHTIICLLQNNNKKLVIAGMVDDENYKTKIIDEATKYAVADRVIFVGCITENDKQWYMKNCEAFVFPSIAEGFGLPVIEAMYFGKAVVIANLTALPEIGGSLAYYFNSFDATDMQQTYKNAIEHYLADDTLPQKIHNHAATFNWANTAQQYLNIYKSLY